MVGEVVVTEVVVTEVTEGEGGSVRLIPSKETRRSRVSQSLANASITPGSLEGGRC